MIRLNRVENPLICVCLVRGRGPCCRKLRLSNAFFSLVLLVPGHALAQLVEALRYKPEGRGFDPRWCHCNFSLT